MAEKQSDGQLLVDHVWFCTLLELHQMVKYAEAAADRIKAADVILRYFATFSQSINPPFIPETMPPMIEVEEDWEGSEEDD